MQPTRRQFGMLALAAAAISAWRPAATAAPWAKGDLAGDIAILRQAFEAMHPGLYRYATKAQTDARFETLAQEFPKSANITQAYLHLTRATAPIQCGHTYPSFFNMPEESARTIFWGRDKLPLNFRWRHGKIIVTQCHADADLPRGTVIDAVNGVPTVDALQALLPLVRADGSNDAKRVRLLEVHGNEEIETFDVLFPLLFPVSGSTFTVSATLPSAASRTVTLPAIDLATRQGLIPPQSVRTADAPKDWQFTHDGDLTILRMDNWRTYDTSWDWRGFLDAGFADMAARASRYLIVDLRGNEGGEDCGHEIIARLIDAPLSLEAYERRVRFRTAPENLAPYLDTWDPSFMRLGEEAEDVGGGYYRLPADNENGQVINPKGPRFRGKVAVLVDAANSSATFQFASVIQRNGLAPLIGAPTGGNQRGINGGAFFFLRLPASQLEVDLPLIGTFPAEEKPDAGLSPDIRVEETAEDITTGRDPVMERARAFLAR